MCVCCEFNYSSPCPHAPTLTPSMHAHTQYDRASMPTLNLDIAEFPPCMPTPSLRLKNSSPSLLTCQQVRAFPLHNHIQIDSQTSQPSLFGSISHYRDYNFNVLYIQSLTTN